MFSLICQDFVCELFDGIFGVVADKFHDCSTT
jgi:hypothetical protein